MKLWLSIFSFCLVLCLSPGMEIVRADHHEEAGHHESDHGDEHHDEDHHAEGGHHAHVGEPAVEPEVFSAKDWRFDFSIYSLLVFVLLLVALSKYAWGPITEGLDQREDSIRKNIEDAETARVRAEEMLADHAKKLDSVQDEVREIIAEARRDAEHTKNEIIASAQKESEATKQRALDEISRARDQALNELFQSMSGQVALATEQVVGRALNDDDRNRLVDEALSQLPQAGAHS